MELLKLYALTFVGLPYIWGGSHPQMGYDCSGLVQELLASVGKDPPGDQTAQTLFDHFSRDGEWNRYGCGTLVFFGESPLKVTHVAMMLDEYRIIEAGSGNSSTTNRESAINRGAFVRVRLIKYRRDIVAVIRPRYDTISCI